LISASDRKIATELIEEATAAGDRENMACQELGISQRTLQRCEVQGTTGRQATSCGTPVPHNKFSEDEVKAILAIVSLPEFQSLPPTQIVHYLAD
jgi:putative transposase